jgi:Anti-sigma-K factor rskA
MSLTEDQRALLRLLLAGDGYAQIAEVMGTSSAEVRARAYEAADRMSPETLDGRTVEDVRDRLFSLNGLDSAAEVASPASREAAPRHYPRALWLAVAAAAVVLAVVVVLTQAGGDENEEPQTTASDQEDIINIELRPVGGSQASGTAAIVRVEDLPAVDLDARGLAPVNPGETYVLWLLGADDRGVPLAFRAVGPDGRFVGRTQIPSAAAGLLPSFERIELSLVRRRTAAAAVNEAAQSRTLPEQVGTTVLGGALKG